MPAYAPHVLHVRPANWRTVCKPLSSAAEWRMRQSLRGRLVAALASVAVTAFAAPPAPAANPIVPNRGVNDPHVRIFQDRAYLYATHDKSADNTSFIMEDWWVWSSDDLVNWTLESVLKPEDTYIGADFRSAWATDAAEKDGEYYWYFSEGNRQTGVVVGDTPTGLWRDVLGGPLLGEDLTPTHEYDPTVIRDTDGQHYIGFGVFDYYIAKLGDDMISLAERPRPIEVTGAEGPYTHAEGTPFDGEKTDDKPFLHERNGVYYLSWGAFYATADNVYGPYTYQGTLLNDESFEDGLDEPTWPVGYLQGRHGSFFSWNGQDYFAYCDISQTGNRYFRDTFISYVHYRADGAIAPIRVERIGVGEYHADRGRIEAENYFSIAGAEKTEQPSASGGFSVRTTHTDAMLSFPNTHGLTDKSAIDITLAADSDHPVRIEVSSEPGGAAIVGSLQVHPTPGVATMLRLPMTDLPDTASLELRIQGPPGVIIDTFTFVSD